MNTFLIPVDFFENNKEHVFLLQQGLTTLSYSIDVSELAERVIGQTTKTVILSFRQDHGLATSMKVSIDMINLLNKLLEQKYRIFGYITDSKNKPVEGVTVKCELTIYQKDSIPLGQGITLKDASYRIYLDQDKLSKLTGTDGLLLHKLCVRITYYKYESEQIIKDNLFIENIETIFNFSSDKLVYTGESIYQSMKTVLSNNDIGEEYLSNVKKPSELLTISSFTGIDKEILIRELFAWKIAASLGLEEIDTQAIFGYLYQNYPLNIPLRLFTDEVKDMDEKEWIKYKNNILFQGKTGLQIMPDTLLSEILKIACKEYYIDYQDDEWISGIVSTIVNTRKEAYYTEEILEGNVTLQEVITCAGVSMTEEKKRGIAALFVAYINDFNRFIEVLNSAEYRTQYGDENINKLIETFQISRFVRNYILLLNGVKTEHQANLLKYSYRYLASLEKFQWESLVKTYGCPEEMKPEDYVNLICENIQKICPDVNTIVQFKGITGFNHLDDITNLLLANKKFNLLTSRAELLTDKEEIIKEVKTVQNIYRITPSPEVAKTMMSNGIKNAGEVYFMGKRQLEERFKGAVAQKDIDAVFDMAAARFSNSLNAFTNINNAFNNLTPQTISSYDLQTVVKELKEEFPDIETLFGNTDYCECEHDRSVYSAAAYLGDLLAYMDARSISPADNTPLKTVFDARRQDISNIYLNEQNTNTVMPYIDLVTEVLEEAVIKTEHSYYNRDVEDCQSTLSSEELCAAPEHLLNYEITKETAYDIIARQIYPMYAPLNIYQTESRAYLKKLGIIRYELMECLQNTVNEELSPLPNTIAAEYFGLTLPGKNIITADSSIDVSIRNTAWHNLIIINDIRKMSTPDFMQDSALPLYEVFDILASDWIGVTSQGFTTDCSYKNKEIEGSVEQFDKAHRFIRFYQKSGWKIWELNLLLNSRIAVQNGYSDSLNAETFYNLMLFKRQQEKLDLSCDALLAFYQEINRTGGYVNAQKSKSLYERIFLRTSLSNPVNVDLNKIFKNPDSSDSKFYPKDYSLIAASLSTSKGDIEILIKSYNHLNGVDPSEGEPHDFACLNYLYRHVVLSQKLNISANELLILEGLCGVDHLQYELNKVDLLIKTSAKIKNFDFTIDNYDFLINRTINPADSSLYKDNISKLRDALSTLLDPPTDDQISVDFKVDDAYRQEFTDHLSNIDRFQDPDKIDALIRIIECTSGKNDPEIDKFVADFFPKILGVEMSGNIHNQTFTTKEDLIARYALVTNYVNDSTDAISIQAVVTSICDLPGNILNPFILHDATLYIDENSIINTTLLKELSTRDYYLASSQNLQTVRIALFMLEKFSMTIEKADLSVADFQLLFDLYDSNKIDFEWLSFKHTSVSQTNTVFQFLELLQMLALRESYGDTSDGDNLLSMINASEDITSFITDLCSLTGWYDDEVTSIGEHFAYDFAAYTKSRTYPVIEQCLAYRETANVPLDTLYRWRIIEEDSDKEVALQIKSAAKSHYDIDTWLEDELPDIQNPLRELKADALASFLIAYDLHQVVSIRKGWKDKIDLYNYFFLDTEMTALMKTSRIVQATCSVQLFVQRCILNLETKVVVDEESDGEWKQWEWMKKYRLWEANRKVFLYPENWIEPELRDDKTPYFKELEEEINQSDVTEEQVETAFENYLHKLQTVSNLTVCGLYREVLDNSGGMSSGGMELKTEKVDTLHVVGKTKSLPVEYYYRSYDALNAKWSYWEKIELDIKGENVIPMVYNRRLYLFWLSTVEKSYNNSANNNPVDPDKYTEIQLGWSMLQHKKWSGVHYSQKKHLQYRQYPASDYSLVAYYNEEYNEIIFSVYNLFYLNEDNPKEYHSCDSQAGIFYFDGDVYRVLSNINQFGSGDYQGAIGEAKQVSATTLNQPTNGDLNLILNEQFITQLSNLNDEHLQLFNKLSNGIGEEVKSEPMIMLNGKSYVYPARSVLRASRLYPMEKDGNDKYKIYLHDNKSTDFYTTRILTTSNPLPNLVQMMHSLPTMWYGLFQSHLLSPMFYQDAKRTFFVKPVNVNLCNWKADYKFYPFYHPYINLFIKELNREGICGLLNRDIQIQPQNYYPQNSFDFDTEYEPADNVQLAEEYQTDSTAPHDILDFNPSGAYSAYNWELFFHIPFYIACKLSQNQKYEEAMNWFHYIFNPTDKTSYSSPQKYWIFKPFFTLSTPENRAQQIREILNNIEDHAAEVNAWLNNPYNPHLVARTRPVAYQKAVVMKYIDNLISWADQLFRQDSLESNNEATLLYILAYEILGKRPVMMPKTASSNINYNDIKDSFQYDYLSGYDTSFNYAFGANATLSNIARPELSQPAFYQQKTQYVLNNAASKDTTESLKSSLPTTPVSQATFVEIIAQEQSVRVGYVQKVSHDTLPRIDADNFCIPYNENLLSYWTTVEDRLFKLRNCMNIEGVVRELPLFEPPIDPAMLVKAAAAGLSIGDALNEITVPQPYYRFRVMMQKAVEFTNEVKQFGDKLLSVLEKKDAETLNLLRSSQEITMQKAIKQIKKLQINEAEQNIESINENIKIAQRKKDYYGSKEFMNSSEQSSYDTAISATVISAAIGQGRSVAGILNMIPDFSVGGCGVGGSPVATMVVGGGQKIASAMNATLDGLSIVAQLLDKTSSLLSVKANYQRRKEEWDFQSEMAGMEMEQLNKQLTASEIRLMTAEKELENLELQIEQSQSVKEYYQNKYTNESLYNWMITKVSGLYFQAYKLAYDMAKKAEQCYCYELGIYDTPDFIQFGYWDSLKKGLLAGDQLIQDLHRLDAAYYDRNKRTMELTKHISLAQMFPLALVKLIAEGSITLELPEFIFDMDYPGHYMRRIKSVSVTIPNVAGPYTNVSFMLTLQSAKIRKNATGDSYDESTDLNDSRFVYQTGGRESICTSSAQNDSGMFELNFGGERYLPFENSGVISKWGLSLPAGCNQFDMSTISDVILHINYTAMYDGNLAIKAKEALQDKLPKAGALLFSPKQDFPDEWNQMDPEDKIVNFKIKTENLPFFLRGMADLKIDSIAVMLSVKSSGTPAETLSFVMKKGDQAISIDMELSEGFQSSKSNVILYEGITPGFGFSPKGDDWSLQLDANLDISGIEEIEVGFTLTTEAYVPTVVTETTPENDEIVEKDTRIFVQFSKNVTAKKLTRISLKDEMDNTIPVRALIEGNTLFIIPNSGLQYFRTYTVSIPKGTLNECVQDESFGFKTQPLFLIHRFPLSSNGNLSDSVGGGSIAPQSTRFVWVGAEGKYKATVQKDLTAAIISGLNLGMEVGNVPHNVTFVLKIKPVSYSYSRIAVLGGIIGLSTYKYEEEGKPVIEEGETAMIAVSFDNGLVKCYKNGELIKSGTTTSVIAESDNTTSLIGRSPYSNGSGSFYIWDIMFFNKVLTDKEIQNLE